MEKPPPSSGTISLARRHALGVMGAAAARLSLIASSATVFSNSVLAQEKGGKGKHLGWDKGNGNGNGNGNDNNAPHCFLRGTRVLTTSGEVAVEDLKIGDALITSAGPRPLKWGGIRMLTKGGGVSWHPAVAPVRIAKSALGDQVPHRDLLVSPDHGMWINGLLIPAKHLINGRSISQPNFDDVETLEYFLVDVGEHAMIVAEGAEAESFRYSGSKVACDNYADYEKMYGAARAVMPAFAPLAYYRGGRDELKALCRLAVSCVYDIRDPVQRTYLQIAERSRLAA